MSRYAIVQSTFLLQVDDENEAAEYAAEADRVSRLNVLAILEQGGVSHEQAAHAMRYLGTSFILVPEGTGL